MASASARKGYALATEDLRPEIIRVEDEPTRVTNPWGRR